MHSITCIIQEFDAAHDTCSVELAGIGIIDAWLDGVAIAPTVDRAFIVGGMPGVITMPDINRPCDATLIQVIPPGTPVSYDPDQIVVYTGSLEIPTDSTGAGCENVLFPQPYSSVPLVSASAAHPASVTISNITETGFTACVTGGKVSSKHSVSYSTKSSKTSTATKNKALTVDHNESDVGTHYILDFKDGDVVFTVTDHASGPARNQVEATLSDAFKATLGGGGGAFHGVRVYAATPGDSTHTGNWLGDNTTGIGCNVTGVTPIDTVDADGDPDGYWDPDNHWIVIPPGLGGRYLIVHKVKWNLIVDTGSGTKDWYVKLDEYGLSGDIFEETGDADSNGSGTFTAGTNQGTALYVREAHFNDGDQIVPHVTFQARWGMQSDAAEFTLIKLAGGGSNVTGHQLKLLAPGGDSGTAGNWLYDYSSPGNPAARFTDAPFPGVTATIDTDSFWDPGATTITIPTGLGGTYLVTYTFNWELDPSLNASSTTSFSLDLEGFSERAQYAGVAADDGFEFTAGVFKGTITISFLAQFTEGASTQPLISAGTSYRVISDLLEFSMVKVS